MREEWWKEDNISSVDDIRFENTECNNNINNNSHKCLRFKTEKNYYTYII